MTERLLRHGGSVLWASTASRRPQPAMPGCQPCRVPGYKLLTDRTQVGWVRAHPRSHLAGKYACYHPWVCIPSSVEKTHECVEAALSVYPNLVETVAAPDRILRLQARLQQPGTAMGLLWSHQDLPTTAKCSGISDSSAPETRIPQATPRRE